MTAPHPVLTVLVADHEAGDPAATAWRVRHADEAFAPYDERWRP
ncbi:hypothetical protein ACFHW2_37315 [Actinomadura sp. LOL_016]